MSKAKPRQTLALQLVALAILLPVLAACGASGDSSGGSGAAAGGGSSAAAGNSTASNSNAQYVKFAQCMRQNGVPRWPDPVDGDKFRFKPGSVDPNSPQFKAAEQKCESVRPPGWAARKDPAAQAKMLKYAQCMRKNGVSNFPDPQGGTLDPGDVNTNSPQFKAARQKCQGLGAGGGG